MKGERHTNVSSFSDAKPDSEQQACSGTLEECIFNTKKSWK